MPENVNDHSLSASIDLDFAEAATQADAFQKKIADIATAFGAISKSVKNLNNSTGTKLQAILSQIENAQKIEITDVEGIREKIEAAIVKSMAGADIDIKGLNGKAFNIQLSENEWAPVNAEFKKKVQEAIQGVNIGSFTLNDVKLNPAMRRAIQGNFETKFQEAVSKVDYKFVDADGKPTQFKLKVTSEHMQGMLDAVRDRFITALSSPDLVSFGAFDEKIKISNPEMDKVYKELAAKMQQFANSIKIDRGNFDTILGLDLNGSAFSSKLAELVKQIELVDKTLKGLDLKANKEDMGAFVKGVNKVKTDLIASVQNFLSQVNKQLDEVKHPSVPDLKQQMNNLTSVIDTAIGAKFDGAIESVIAQMGLMRMDINGKEVFVPVIKRLEQALINAAQKAIPESNDPALSADLMKVQTTIKEWAGNLSKALAAETEGHLKGISSVWTANHKALLESYSKSVSMIASFAKFGDSNEPLTLSIPFEELKQRLIPELQRAVNMVVEKATFTRDGGEITGIEINADSMKEALRDIRETLLRQASAMAEGLKNADFSMDENARAYMDRLLHDESKNILDLVMDRTRSMVKSFAEGATGDMGSEDRDQIHAEMKNAMHHIIGQFMGVMESVVGAFTYANSAFQTIQQTAISAVEEMEKSAGKSNRNADMNEIAQEILNKTFIAAWNQVQSWVPSLTMPKLDFGSTFINPLVDAIKKGLEEGIIRSAAGVSDLIERSMLTVTSGSGGGIDWQNLKRIIAKPQGYGDIDIERWTDLNELDKWMNANGVARKNPAPRNSYGFVERYKNLEPVWRKVFMSNELWSEENAGNPGSLPPAKRIMETVMHEVGHILEKEFLEKYGKTGGNHGGKYELPPEWQFEAEMASRQMRPVLWDMIDNRTKYPGISDQDHIRNQNYMSKFSEKFADAFSFSHNRPEEAEKYMPNLHGMFKDFVKKFDFVDPDQPEGNQMNLDGLADINGSLVRYVQRAVASITEYINHLDFDDHAFGEAIDLLDNVIQARIHRLTESLRVTGGNDGSEGTGEALRLLNDSFRGHIVHFLSALGGAGHSEFNPSTIIDDICYLVRDKINELIKEVQASPAGKNQNIGSVIEKLDEFLFHAISNRMKNILGSLTTAAPGGTGAGFRIKFDSLDEDVRKIIAERMQKTMKELRKENKGYLTGSDALSTVAEANIEAVFRKFHTTINEQATKIVETYKGALEKVDIQPDLSPIPHLIKKFEEIQAEIATKVKEQIEIQFRHLAQEIRALRFTPVSLGGAPTDLTGGTIRSTRGGGGGGQRSVGSAAPTPSYGSPRMSYGGGRMYYSINDYGMNPSEQKFSNPGGDSKSFMGSVVNTMRYMTAGMLMGGPTMLLYQAIDSAKEFEYQMQKAKVNLTAKAPGGKMVDYNSDDVTRKVQDLGINNSISQVDAARAYQAATMKYDNPYEALVVANSAAKIKAIEDVDVEDATKGLTAMASQYGLGGKDVDQVTNMMIAAANTKFTTIQDLLDTQKRAGSVFSENLPGMSKRQQLATSIGLSALYTEATGRSGAQGGTFFKNIMSAPFSKQGTAFLEKMSQSSDPRLQALNPYTSHVNKDGQAVYEQKNGLDMLYAMTDAMKALDDKSKQQMLDEVAKSWFKGDMQSVQALMTDMDKVSNSADVQAQGGVKGFMDKLGGNPDDLAALVASMSGTMQNTYKYMGTKMKSELDAATFSVLEQLKDEFSELATVISNVLEGVRDNAGIIASALTNAAKAATVLGAAYVIRKSISKHDEYKENKRQKGLVKQYNGHRYYMNEEGRAVNLNRMIVASKYGDVQGQLDRVNKKRGIIDVGKYNEDLKNINAEYAGVDRKKVEMEMAGQQNTPEYTKVLNRHTELEGEKAKLDRRHGITSVVDPALAAEAKALEKELLGLRRKFDDVDKQAVSLNNRMDLLDDSMKDQRVDAGRLTQEMQRVGTGFETAEAAAKQLRERIHMIGKESGLSSDGIERLYTDVDKLNREFAQDGDLDKYIKKMRELERLNKLQNTAVIKQYNANNGHQLEAASTATVASRQTSLMGPELAQLAVGLGAPLLMRGGGGGPGPAKPGLFKRMGSFVASGFGLSKLKGGGGNALKAGGKLLKVGGKALLYGKLATTAFDAFENLVLPATMSKEERAASDAQKRVDLVQKVKNINDAKSIGGKTLNGFLYASDMLTDSFFNLLGGTSPSWGEYSKGITALSGGSKGVKNLEAELHGQADLDTANRKQNLEETRKLLEADPSTAGLDGNGSTVDWNTVSSYEDGQQMLEYIQQKLSRAETSANSDYTGQKNALLIRGVREDSKVMRDLLKDFFTKNIKALDIAIADATDRRDHAKAGSEAQAAAQDAIDQLNTQKSDYQLQLVQTDYGRVDETSTNLNDALTQIQAKYQIKRDDAILAGAAPDSAVIDSINRAEALDSNSQIDSAKSVLAKYLDEYKDNETMRKAIEQQMLQLSVQQKDNLVGIKKAVEQDKSTFNLPDGVLPMTYWESKVQDGTHKNMSVGNGDTSVNITIDKMTGTDADLQALGETVAAAVNRTRATQVSRILASQVSTGIQNNHR